MKVHQPGSWLMDERGAKVRDWSLARTRRRLGLLARLARPYHLRAGIAVAALLAATVVSLAPPYLAKLAIDDGIRAGNLKKLAWIVVVFVVVAVAGLILSGLQTYLTSWVGERLLADLRTDLFGHLQRLSLGYFERNRAGVIVSRLTNDIEALDQIGRAHV
jgi:ABC-type multidrug transport system fused ATPase/permease subunit